MIDWPFLAALLAGIFAGVALRNRSMAGAATILLADWAACSIIAYVLNDPYPWLAFAMVDYPAAIILLLPSILLHRVSLPLLLITLIFAAEIVCHSWQGMAAFPAYAKYEGWYFLKYAAWAQVVVVGAWGVGELAGRYGLPRRGITNFLHVLGRVGTTDDEGAKSE